MQQRALRLPRCSEDCNIPMGYLMKTPWCGGASTYVAPGWLGDGAARASLSTCGHRDVAHVDDQSSHVAVCVSHDLFGPHRPQVTDGRRHAHPGRGASNRRSLRHLRALGPSVPHRLEQGPPWSTQTCSQRSATLHPAWRARSVGSYQLWRDGGFAVGAVLSGVLADLWGVRAAVWTVAALTAVSGALVAARMHETRRHS